jgi:D-glycerate 3-kinase
MHEIDYKPFLEQQRLPDSYIHNTETWFYPIAKDLAEKHTQNNHPLIIGINGAQGSGKSTLGALLVYLFNEAFNLNAISLSIDDFYHTKAKRNELAEQIHPLMATRGAPGTHDLSLAHKTIDDLLAQKIPVTIPRFNKATDDRHEEENWDVVTHPVDIIILEGWCVGAHAVPNDELINPINELESHSDPEGIWRQFVNTELADDYTDLFNRIDSMIMLKAPSFDCVYNWRCEQEHKLRQSLIDPNQAMNDEQVLHFIQHYQRITQNILKTLPSQVDYLLELNTNREITKSVYAGEK